MASTPDYLHFILDQLSDIPEISYRSMMGEYLLYYRWKIVGWIYDNRLLLKPTEQVKHIIKTVEMQLPYPGAKPMIYVDTVDNSEYVKKLIETTYQHLK